METTRFDEIASTLATASNRRGALRFLAAAAFGLGTVAAIGSDESAARRRGGKKKGGRGRGGRGHAGGGTGGSGGTAGVSKNLRDICLPGRDTCRAGLQCGTPTTRHTCSSTVDGIDTWCCLPQGSVCSTECDCCGDNYCSYDDNNVGHCVSNPEG